MLYFKLNYKLVLLTLLLFNNLNISYEKNNNEDDLNSEKIRRRSEFETTTILKDQKITQNIFLSKLNSSRISIEKEESNSNNEVHYHLCSNNKILGQIKFKLAIDNFEDKSILQRTYNYNYSAKVNGIKLFLDKQMNNILRTLPLSSRCSNSLDRIGKDIKQKKEWALNC